MHEVIALHQRIAARDRLRPQPFSLSRIDAARFVVTVKAPDKIVEARASRPPARREDQRLAPRSDRTGRVGKLRHRVARAGKLRLFRLWKLFEQRVNEPRAADAPARPLAERLAWLRRTRRL